MTGSATPKNSRPIPIPAANSMANHDQLEYSGLASGPPRRMRPRRVGNSTRQKRRKTFAAAMNIQSNVEVSQA